MKVFFRFITIKVVLIILLSSSVVFAADKKKNSISPATRPAKWRIGYLEGGPYKNYQRTLAAIVEELSELGWIEKINIPPQEDKEDTGKLWAWVAANTRSRYLQFVADAHWSNCWDSDIRKKNKKLILKRLNEDKNIDLMIAMGTWAGQNLANNDHSVPTIVCSTSDAVASKIVKSTEDSGYDHIHAHLDPTHYERQIRSFHEIIGFKKLGVAFENSIEGRSYAAIETIEKIARELKFEVITCHTESDIPDIAKTEASMIKCANELAPKIDAFYLTEQSGVTLKSLPKIVAALNAHKVPTFSQAGSDEVRYGVLLSVAQANFRQVGRFHAETIARILNGTKPRDLEQVFEPAVKIAINLEEAQIIGWKPIQYIAIATLADEVYEKIESSD